MMNVKEIIMDGNGGGVAGDTNWVVKDDGNNCDSISIISEEEDSMNSVCSSSSSSDLAEDASTSSSTSSYPSTSASSSHSSNGPLYELSDLMNHLPIKRGLSMFYEGKAQSFTSLARVQSIEDLPKKETPYRKRMKSCKSYGGGLDHSHRISSYYSPKATISKKASSSRGSLVTAKRSGTRPSISIHNNYF